MEDEILPALRELGIGFVVYSPLGHGFLSGQWKSFEDLPKDDPRKARFPRLQEENFEKNLELVERLRGIADEKGATPGQLVLAWPLHQGDDIVPLPGTKRRKYLEENAAAADVALTDEDLARASRRPRWRNRPPATDTANSRCSPSTNRFETCEGLTGSNAPEREGGEYESRGMRGSGNGGESWDRGRDSRTAGGGRGGRRGGLQE